MSLLTICQYAADEAGLSRPSSVVGSSNATARQVLRYAIRTGRDIVKKSHPYLIKEASFTTVDSQASYDFEDDLSITDFDHFVPFTQWNQDESRIWIGVSPQEWQLYKSGLATVSLNTRYRLRGKDRSLILHETPSSAQTVQFEYVSKNYCLSAAAAEQSVWTADTDTAVCDEELFELGVLWRALKRAGLPYAEEKAEFARTLMLDLSRVRGHRKLSFGRVDTISNVPDANWDTSGL